PGCPRTPPPPSYTSADSTPPFHDTRPHHPRLRNTMSDDFDRPLTQLRRRRVAALVAAVLLLVLAYAAAAAYASGRVPSDTAVGGVQVGGLEPAAARAALAKGIEERAAAPVTITAGDKTATISPAEAGLEVDLDKSIENLTGFSLN